MAIGSNLAQAALDIGLPGSPLTSVHFRARIAGYQTGAISLAQLKGATTAMCYSHSYNYGLAPANPYTSYVKEQNSNRRDITFPTGDKTEQVLITCSCNTANVDAFAEIRYPGYSEAGTYNVSGQADLTGIYQDAAAPWAMAAVVNNNGWLNGAQTIPWSQEGQTKVNVNANFTVPAGYPYITLICYQLVRISAGARYNTDYNSVFTNVRIRKL